MNDRSSAVSPIVP